jgi:RNA polymerase sigma-70 factor, ECF subfamily
MPAHAAIATTPSNVLADSPSPETSATAVLTRALATGDESAFREFHAQYFDRLLRYHIVLARGDEQSARDALQETLTRVAKKVRQFDDESVFWSWLTVVARSTAIDGGRKRTRYGALLRKLALGWFTPMPEPATDADAQLHEQLDRALATLDADDRELIEAKYFSAASVRELAGRCSVTEKAIESRLLRLRRQLREFILKSLRHEKQN